MFALPAVPQDLAISPRARAAEVRGVVPAEFLRAVEARTAAEYDEAMEELLALDRIPTAPIDLNALFAAFGSASYPFVQSLAEFVQMRRLVPYAGAHDMERAIQMMREEVFANATSLEYGRRVLEFVEVTVGLCAIIIALHQGKQPSQFFARTLAERSLTATRELRILLESVHAEEVSSAVPEATVAKLTDWATKGKDGVFRPFGEHIE